jgi:hypothetical protein
MIGPFVPFESDPVPEIDGRATGKSPAVAVVDAIAALEAVDPAEMPPIRESVEPDVMNALLDHRAGMDGSVLGLCFHYAGWNVFVRGDGTFVVADPDNWSEPTPLFYDALRRERPDSIGSGARPAPDCFVSKPFLISDR